ncbi:MAG: hypothetical protein LUI06_05735 [Ruminococcus sp.]|nr:hypothetical protein [Ruminococcus sp.]
MGIFSRFVTQRIPKECEGLKVRIESSTCTGERTIGFYDPSDKRLHCAELVRSDEDIEAFYKKYGLERE